MLYTPSPGDGGFFSEIPRGTPGRGILKLRIPRGPRGGGYFLVPGYGISIFTIQYSCNVWFVLSCNNSQTFVLQLVVLITKYLSLLTVKWPSWLCTFLNVIFEFLVMFLNFISSILYFMNVFNSNSYLTFQIFNFD